MPLEPEAPTSESAVNQDILNFEQEEHSPRRMEMSPGGGESWTKTEAKRKLEGCCTSVVLSPFQALTWEPQNST